jgi:translation initiation factor 2 beta subunit (eIF-2beta)/eIF-5
MKEKKERISVAEDRVKLKKYYIQTEINEKTNKYIHKFQEIWAMINR